MSYIRTQSRRFKIKMTEPEDNIIEPGKQIIYNLCKKNINNSQLTSSNETKVITKIISDMDINYKSLLFSHY